MQHQLLSVRARVARLLAQLPGIGQERHSERARQFPSAFGVRPIQADIIDHDGDQRAAVEIAERHRIAPPRLLGLRRRRDLRWRRARLLLERCGRRTRFGLAVARQSGQILDARVAWRRRGGLRFSLHVLERVAYNLLARTRVQALRQPVTAKQSEEEECGKTDGNSADAMCLCPVDEKSPTHLDLRDEPPKGRIRPFRTLSVRLPTSVLLSGHLRYRSQVIALTGLSYISSSDFMTRKSLTGGPDVSRTNPTRLARPSMP